VEEKREEVDEKKIPKKIGTKESDERNLSVIAYFLFR
jgi:hypothetical protein